MTVMFSPVPGDNGPALQALIDTVHANGGGDISLPSGSIRFDSQFAIKPGVRLIGSGAAGWDWRIPAPDRGTVLEIRWGQGGLGPELAACLMHRASSISNLTFSYPDQDPLAAAPIPWGASIMLYEPTLNNYNQSITNIYFHRSYAAIDARGSLSGDVAALSIEDVMGTPIAYGILIDRVTDWCRLRHIQFNGGHLTYHNGSWGLHGLSAWAAQQGIAFRLGGCDWLQLIDCQVAGYWHGAAVYAGAGYPAGGPYTFQNCQFDICPKAIYLVGNFTQIVRVFGCSFAPYSRAQPLYGQALGVDPGIVLPGLQFTGNYIFGPADSVVWAAHANQTLGSLDISHNQCQAVPTGNPAFIITSGNDTKLIANQCNGFAAVDCIPPQYNPYRAGNSL